MIAQLLETFVAVTALMLVVLAVRRPVANLFGAGWAYALWLLPALRLVLPPLPSIAPEIPIPAITVFIPAVDGVTAPPMDPASGQWMPFLLALWAGGAVTFLLWHWLTYRAFLNALKTGARPGDPPSYGGIATLASPAVDGPLALGMLKRLIVQPLHFARRYNPAERRLAMEHELVHHRRGDIWFNLAGLLILAANWFNPIAWFAFHAFRSDQELACDAAVAKRASGDERHDYARALVKSASRPGLIAACPLNPADQLKHRLRMIRAHRVGTARNAGGLAAFAILLVAGLSLSGASRPIEAVQPMLVAETQVATTIAPSRNALTAAAVAPAAHRAASASSAHRFRLAASLPELVKARVASVQPKGFAMLAEAEAPAAMPVSLVRMSAAEAAQLHHAQLQVRPAEAGMPRLMPAVAMAPEPGQRVRPAKAGRIMTFLIEGTDIRFTVAAGTDPERMQVIQNAVEQAIAQAEDPSTRVRLEQVLARLDRKADKFGMVSNVN